MHLLGNTAARKPKPAGTGFSCPGLQASPWKAKKACRLTSPPRVEGLPPARMGLAGIAGEQDRRGRGMAEGYPLGGRVTNK